MSNATDRTTYSVHKAVDQNEVIIALEGYGPSERNGYLDVGSFSLPIDSANSSATSSTLNGPDGEHILISKAKELLKDSSDSRFAGLDFNTMVFKDQASNAPVQARREELTGGTEQLPSTTGDVDPEHSSQPGGEGNTGLPKDELEPNGVTPTEEGAEIDGNEDGSGTESEEESDFDPVALREGNLEDDEETGSDGVLTRIAALDSEEQLKAVLKAEKDADGRKGVTDAVEKRIAELNEPAEQSETEQD